MKNYSLPLIVFLCLFAFSDPISSFAQSEAPSVSRVKAKGFNPDIGVNFLGLFLRSTGLSRDPNQVPHNGFSLQESEFQFSADVDPYLKASALFSVAQENGQSDFSVSPEEVFLETTSLPSVTIKAGKFKAAFGKHNLLHTHAFPFIDAPLVHQTIFGAEGLNEAGISAAVLLPAAWYSEITAQVFSARNEGLLNSPTSSDLGQLLHFKNLWDLSDDLTFEGGLSGLAGNNSVNQTATAFGADLTFKWRPAAGGKYKAFSLTTEVIYANRNGITDSTSGMSAEKIGGISAWAQYQFAERWWSQARYDRVRGISQYPGASNDQKFSALVGFFPSEFSGFRLQYDLTYPASRETHHTLGLQYNISIGAHPAHAY